MWVNVTWGPFCVNSKLLCRAANQDHDLFVSRGVRIRGVLQDRPFTGGAHWKLKTAVCNSRQQTAVRLGSVSKVFGVRFKMVQKY